MQLFYYQRPDQQPNFGDELNRWLWQQTLPELLDDDSSTVLVGIGTLLNNKLPQRIAKAQHVIVFSTGAGYEQRLRAIPRHWHIYAVRGPLTARLLGLPENLALTDGAILLRRWYQPIPIKCFRFAFMPHVHHANFATPILQQVCRQLGFAYIDPRGSVEAILDNISQTEVLITEAMHGAIAADALRVPWIPVITSSRILKFKWRDWHASIGLPYQPQYLAPVTTYPAYAKGLRSTGKSLIHWWSCYRQWPIQHITASRVIEQDLARNLQAIAQTIMPSLSNDKIIEQLTVKLEERLDLVRRKCQN
jgi:succinoglycan biosynthesis protein ExoV